MAAFTAQVSTQIWGTALALGLSIGSGLMADGHVIKSHGISTFGELKYAADFTHFDYVNVDAPKGGTFSTWGFGTFDSMMPYILKGQAASLASAQFETLMTGTADEPDAMYGLLAHTIEYPEDRSWATFHLRPEAKFSNGTQVTAQDVVFSFNVLIEKGRPSYATTFSDFENVEALDPLTVKFTFKEGVNTRELPQAAAGLPIFSEAYFANIDFSASTMTPPIGSGDYILSAVEPGKTVSYKRRDDYWGKDLALNVGRSNFDEIKIEYFGDYTVAFEAFKAGKYAYREEYASKLWATAYDFPAIDKGWVKTEILPDGRPAGTQGFWFNLRREKFQDPAVREALGLMFNFEWSNKALFYGIYTRTDSFWENSHMQAEGPITDGELALLEPLREHLPATVFTEDAYIPTVSKPNQLDRGVFRKAGKLLDAAGWVPDGKFRKNAKGETLSVEFLNDSPSFERIINPFVENLIKLGVDARLTSVDPAQETERTKKFDYDIKIQRFSMSLTPGLELRSIFSSKTANTPDSANLAGIANPAIDALLDTIEGAKTRDDLNVAVQALDRALRAMHIWIPQWYKPSHNVAYIDVFEYPENLPPYALGESDFWWYNADKAAKLKAEGAL